CGFACLGCCAFCSGFAFSSCFCSLSLAMGLGFHLLVVTLEHAHLAPVLQHLGAGAVRLLRLRVVEGHVGNVDRQVLVDDAALLALHRVGALVLLHAIDALHHHV